MKKITMALAVGLIAAASFACCNCGKQSVCTSVQTCVTSNCVCSCHNGQACSASGCVCDCHSGCKCKCHSMCRCNCCCCYCNGCNCECGCSHKEYSCGNGFLGFKVTVTKIGFDVLNQVPPQQQPQIPQTRPQMTPQQGNQYPVPQTGQMPQQAAAPQPPMQNMMYAPVVPIYQTWVEGRYTTGVLANGTVVKTWIPGHYENCQLIGQ